METGKLTRLLADALEEVEELRRDVEVLREEVGSLRLQARRDAHTIASLRGAIEKAVTSRYIHVATEFSRFPAGRHGPCSGERFREELLAPALRGNMHVTVLLDGTMGYCSTFLEEAFGGLVRSNGFMASDLHKTLTVYSAYDRSLVAEIWSYIDVAKEIDSATLGT